MVVSGSRDTTVKVWDVANESELVQSRVSRNLVIAVIIAVSTLYIIKYIPMLLS